MKQSKLGAFDFNAVAYVIISGEPCLFIERNLEPILTIFPLDLYSPMPVALRSIVCCPGEETMKLIHVHAAGNKL